MHFKDEFWIAYVYGCVDEAKKLGINLTTVQAGGYGQITNQVNQIEDFIAKSYDGIILGAVDYEGPAQAVAQAWDNNIPVVAGNNLVKEPRTPVARTDDYAAGAMQADFIGKNYPNAKVAFLNGPAGSTWSMTRSNAFKETLKKYPGVELLTDKYHNMDRISAMNAASDIIQKYPEIDIISNSTDLQAKGCVDALRSFGKKPGEIKITMLTMGSEAFELMKEGWMQYAIAERPVFCGRLVVRMLAKILEGEPVEKDWKLDMPGFTNSPEDIKKFEEEEWKHNWAPEGWKP